MDRLTAEPAHIRLLRTAFGGILSTHVPLHKFSRWKIGGMADALIEPRNLEELQQVRVFLHKHGIPNVTIGETSNLLFADEGLRAVALKLGKSFRYIKIDGSNVTTGGATWVPKLARTAMKSSLSGLEHTCGIPGTAGGLVYMNGGSQRRGIGDNIIEVTSVDSTGRIITRTKQECRFSYRSSIFHKVDEVIAEVGLTLNLDTPRTEIRKAMLSILRSRRGKFPRKQPNCGSVFVSDPAMYVDFGPPGKIIEQLGFKGHIIGGAQISTIHANFINNMGTATAEDVLTLIYQVRQEVMRQTGYTLRVEARYVSELGQIEEI